LKPVKTPGKPNPAPALAGAYKGETAHKGAPEKPSENDLIRKALEAAGFKMTGDPISLGGKLFVGIHPPVQPPATPSTNRNKRIRHSLQAAGFKMPGEQIQYERIRQSLQSAGFRMTGYPISLGGKLFVGLHPRSWNKEAPVVNPSLSPQVALPAAVDVATRTKKAEEQQRDLLSARITKKLNNPAGNPTMTVEQVAYAFSVSKGTIYRWIANGRKQGPEGIHLIWAAHGKIPTDLVRRALRPT
jgi:hypothetical protein